MPSDLWPKLARWLLFCVVISLLPFGIAYLDLHADEKSPKIEDPFSRGELLLVSTAIGGLIGVRNTPAIYKIISGGVSLGIVFLQAARYAYAGELSYGLDSRRGRRYLQSASFRLRWLAAALPLSCQRLRRYGNTVKTLTKKTPHGLFGPGRNVAFERWSVAIGCVVASVVTVILAFAK